MLELTEAGGRGNGGQPRGEAEFTCQEDMLPVTSASEHQKAAPMLSTPQVQPKPLPVLAGKAKVYPSPSTAPKEGNRKLTAHQALKASGRHGNNKGSGWQFPGSCT